MNPPQPPSRPSWDLSLVLRALQQSPFELKFISLKSLLLAAFASIKRVGDLHAFSVDKSCLEFRSDDSQVTQGSYYLLQRSGSEPASAAPGGGRPSPSFALPRPSLEMVRGLDTKLQDLRSALCLLRRPAEGECHLQAEDGSLDSGCHHPVLSGTGCVLPAQVASSLY